MTYVFMIENDIIGVVNDEKELKKAVVESFGFAVNNQLENELIIHALDDNTIDETFSHPTYEVDKYFDYDLDHECLGLRLVGLGGEIDMPLGIKYIEE